MDVNTALGEDLGLSSMIHQTDQVAPEEARNFYKSDEYKDVLLPGIVAQCRQVLDAGAGDRLMNLYRSRENQPQNVLDGRYQVIIVGALLMRAGARIRKDDLNHLRELLPLIPCREQCERDDEGFRGPGKAHSGCLDYYKPGIPRNFQEPRQDFLRDFRRLSADCVIV